MSVRFLGVKKLHARVINNTFLYLKRTQFRLHRKSPISILFSRKEDWQPIIEEGLKFSKYKIAFEELTPDNISNFDLVVPLTISDLIHLNDFPYKISTNPIPIPTTKSVLLCDDKFVFNESMVEMGFSQYIPKMGGKHKFPYMVKKRVDVWGVNTHIIHDSQDEAKYKELLDDEDYFTQELVLGNSEYATHILFINGEIAYSLNIKYVFDSEMPIKGQVKQVYLKIEHCPYLELFANILKAIDFNGLCCFNYKVRNKKPLIFEINPRFGGSLGPYFFTFLNHVH